MPSLQIKEEPIELTTKDVQEIIAAAETELPIAAQARDHLERARELVVHNSTDIDFLDMELIQKEADLISRHCSSILQRRFG